MKTLILTRHAKSAWSDPQQQDHARELNQRGKLDAPMMGKRLHSRGVQPDLILSSTAKRAAETALLIADELGYESGRILWHDRLYHAPAQEIQDVLMETDDQFEVVMVVCHNNGISDFAYELSGGAIDSMPTCGMAAFSFDTEQWSDFSTAAKRILFYDYPKLSLH